MTIVSDKELRICKYSNKERDKFPHLRNPVFCINQNCKSCSWFKHLKRMKLNKLTILKKIKKSTILKLNHCPCCKSKLFKNSSTMHIISLTCFYCKFESYTSMKARRYLKIEIHEYRTKIKIIAKRINQ